MQRLEQRNFEGKTALLYAADQKKNSVVAYLLRMGRADIWVRDTVAGENILHHAVKDRNYGLAEVIFSIIGRLCL